MQTSALIEKPNGQPIKAAEPLLEKRAQNKPKTSSSKHELHHSIPAKAQEYKKDFIDPKDLKTREEEDLDSRLIVPKPKEEKPEESKSFTAAGIANFISVGLNTVSAITNFADYFSSDKSENTFIKKATKGGELGTKFFYAVNSIQNIYNRLKKNDFLGGLGYLFDLPIAALAPQKNIFLWRGLSTGAYCFSNGAKEAIQKPEFKNIFDHVKGLGHAVNKILSYAENGFKGFWDNLIDSKTGLQQMLAGMLLFISPIIWRLTGLKFFGTCIRDLGGITQDLAQAKFGYILDKEEQKLPFFTKLSLSIKRAFGMSKIPKDAWPTFFRSGLGVTAGTVCDWVRGVLEKTGANQSLINAATALTYITDGTGIYLLGRSQDTEIGTNKEESV